ncbi:MAG: AraC family transcriptional regulator, partial [Planctomycetota bacterium]
MDHQILLNSLKETAEKKPFVGQKVICWSKHSSALKGKIKSVSHVHTSWELQLVLDGTVSRDFIDGSTSKTGPGEILLIPPGVPHLKVSWDKSSSNVRWIAVALDMKRDSLSVFYNGHHERILFTELDLGIFEHFAFARPEILVSRAGDAFDLLEENDAVRYVHSVTDLIINAFYETVRQSGSSHKGQKEKIEDQVMKIISGQFYNKDLSLSLIANELRITPHYLARLFKKRTGNTVHQVLLSYRLERAHALLKTRRYLVKEVSLLTGWAGPHHFSSAFHKYFGSCPS